MPRTLKQRYEVDRKTGCWNWLMSVDDDGYAYYPDKKISGRAARTYYIQKYGPVESDLVTDHLCRNRRCVNPDHLEMVTNAENTRRGESAKLDWKKVEKIRNLYSSKSLTQTALARKFGVCQSHVSRVVNLEHWATA